jgi:hypothetical protein
MTHAAPLLIEQRNHHVAGFDELLIASDSETLGIRQGHLEFGC